MARRTGVGRETELQLGSERFAEWRRTRRRGTPIPVELWELLAVGIGHRQEAATRRGRCQSVSPRLSRVGIRIFPFGLVASAVVFD